LTYDGYGGIVKKKEKLMESKNKLKNFTIVMLVALIVVQFTTHQLSSGRNGAQGVHEVFGIVTFVVIILHLIANRKWISGVNKKIGKKSLTKPMKVRFIAAILMCLSFIGLAVTGILMSRVILVNVGSPRNAANLGEVHGLFFFLSLVLVLFHIYLNKNYLKSWFKKKAVKKD
jgi:cytochrome b561